MRKLFIIALFSLLIVASQLGLAQQSEPLIKIDEATASIEKISNNNFKLKIHWAPFPGAHRYRIRFVDTYIGVIDAEDQLDKSRLTEGTETTITLPLEKNSACFQVIALDEAGGDVGESCIYRATMSYDPAPTGGEVNWVFPSAFYNSFKEMDPFAGWIIVGFIVALFFYGGYMAVSINRQIRKQNHLENQGLLEQVKIFTSDWKQAAKDKEKLIALKNKINQANTEKYCILGIFEKGLANHIDNIDRPNVSEEVDRDMEKSIVYELENIKLGNYSRRAKHISLNRIKMFGETAPMLGLLGTVSGLIVAFFNILVTSQAGGAYQELLAELSSGIYSAIVTTIIGLIIGILLLFIHHGVESNLKRLQNAWLELYINISKNIS